MSARGPAAGASSDQLQGEALVDRIASIASDRKAIDIRVLDVRGMVGYTDFFVICSGNTERQTKAIHDAIHEELKGDGVLPRRVEGAREARWVLMDYLDCGRPHLHAGRARVLPPGAALGRGPGARGGLSGLGFLSGTRTSVRVVLTTNQKGAIAETAILHEATKHGIVVYRPAVEGARADMIFEIGAPLVRVQCKWARLIGQIVEVRARTCRRGPNGTYVRSTYSADEVDAVAAYCPELDRCYLVPIRDVLEERTASSAPGAVEK